ncbi:MAG: cytochrome c biogenesis protein CcsA [Alphaproteobacteria bacterium]|nr:cytochrome c biogenesis protein CcsA [Alphaproteobacteria bacterium]
MVSVSPAILHISAVSSLIPMIAFSVLNRHRSISDKAGLYWVCLGFATLTLAGWIGWRLAQQWAFGFGAALDVAAATTFLAFGVTALFAPSARGLTALILAYCFPILILAHIAGDWRPAGPDAAVRDAWFWAHIAFSAPAFGFIGVAAIAGVAVWLREHMLKSRRNARFVEGLPALTVAEALQFRLLSLSAAFLFGAVATGAATSFTAADTLAPLDHKSILSVVGLGLVVALLVMHAWFGLRGRKAVRVALAAFLVFQLAYPGVKFVTEVMAGAG